MQVHSLCREDPLEEGMATHSSILAWRIPWTEEPGRLQSTGSQTVGNYGGNLACTHTHTHRREWGLTEERGAKGCSTWVKVVMWYKLSIMKWTFITLQSL